jgi:hypothetical protein
LFNSYNLDEIAIKSPNAIVRNKFSLYFGLRKYLVGSEVVIHKNYPASFSPMDFQNMARVKTIFFREYQQEISESSFMDLMGNNKMQKLIGEEFEILIMPNPNKSYHLYTFRNNFIFR